jgi:DNA-binding transcriptional regulator LsrR (DeoR family)
MSDELNFIAAILFYERKLSQTAIAHCLGLSNITISRMLQKAKETGIVKTEVRFPFVLDVKLGKRIASSYGLEEAVVVQSQYDSKDSLTDLLGKTWALRMALDLADGTVLGLGLGITVAGVIQFLIPMHHTNVHVVQIIGGLPFVTKGNPFSIIQEACKKLDAAGTYLSANAIVESKQMRDLLFKSSAGKECLRMWEKCTEAIFGVGSLEAGSFIYKKMVSPEVAESLRKLGAVGDILGHCFDARGKFLQSDWEELLISIPIDLLRSVPRRIMVAGGKEKAAAILAALKARMATILVTDQATAYSLVS